MNEGVEALQNERRDNAGALFLRALDSFGEIADAVERRNELGPFALWLDRVGFPDLALMAAQDAIAIDRELGDPRQLGEDIVTSGNAHMHMGNLEPAEGAYREALGIFLANGDLDNAASASTNLALIVGNAGRMHDAISLMYESLGYLERRGNDDTEIITRIALTQALEAVQGDPEAIFAVAKPAHDSFRGELRPDQVDGLRGPLRSAARRHPSGQDPDALLAAEFPGFAD